MTHPGPEPASQPPTDDHTKYVALLRRAQVVEFRRRQREQLYFFVLGAFKVLHRERRDANFVDNWHIEAMCYQLQRIATGQNQRLLITVPPRHLKTICTSIALPAFYLGHNPGARIIAASYGQDLSGKNLQDQKLVMESEFYRQLFPNVRIRMSGSELHTSHGGGVRATSVGGAITGYGADLIIVDDLMKASEALHAAERQRAQEFVRSSLATRLDDKNKGAIVSIQQRLHEDDIAGHMIESGEYFHLNLPAIAEEAQVIELSPTTNYTRRKGDLLFPQRESRQTLDRLRKELGAFQFSAQYQQNPIAPGSNRLNWNAWKTHETQPDRDYFQLVVQSWDTAMSAEPTSDYSACTTWGFRDKKWYLLDVFRSRLDFGDLKSRVRSMIRTWQADLIIIENAATGKPLLTELRREHGLGDKLHIYNPRYDKATRFETQIARLSDGAFYLPAKASWLAEFRRECQGFPSAKNDDMVDSMVQFLEFLGHRAGLRLTNSFAPRVRPDPQRPMSLRRY